MLVQQFLAADADAMVLNAEQTTELQLAQYLSDRLAGSADHVGNLLMGHADIEMNFIANSGSVTSAEPQHQLDDSAIYVVIDQVHQHVAQHAHAARKCLHDDKRRPAVGREIILEL